MFFSQKYGDQKAYKFDAGCDIARITHIYIS